MSTLAVVLDANLLVLFVVGAASKDFIARHKRLSAYTVEDYVMLRGLVSRARSVLVTPNTLTEASNLASQIAPPARTRILQVLQTLVAETAEIYVPSKLASKRSEFIRLGLADSVLVELGSQDVTVVTADLGLYLAMLDKGAAAINFNHLRDQRFGGLSNDA